MSGGRRDARLGPYEIRLLRKLAEGPLTTIAAARVVMPESFEVATRTGNLRDLTRGVGGMLGRLERRKLARHDEAATTWTATPAGLALARGSVDVDGLPAHDGEGPWSQPPRKGWRLCTSCRRWRPREHFRSDRSKQSKKQARCALCHAEAANVRRQGQRIERDADLEWAKWSKARLVAQVTALLRAARLARRTAMFRGKDGIGALRALHGALHPFFNAADRRLVPEDIEERSAPDCTCPFPTCERHATEHAIAGTG